MKKSTVKACFYALGKLYNGEIPEIITRKRVAKLVGRPFVSDLSNLLDWSEETISRFIEYYNFGKEKFAYLNRLNKNAIKMLARLKANGKELVLVTNKKRSEANRLISSFCLGKYFDKVVCRDDGDFENKQDMIHSLAINLNECLIYGNMNCDAVPGAKFVRAHSSYGDILINLAKFCKTCDEFVRNVFQSNDKYFLQGFT